MNVLSKIALVSVAACGVSGGGPDFDPPSREPEASRPPTDASRRVAKPALSPPEPGVRLRDGTFARGAPIARYDHARWWWDASPEVTFALFDEDAHVRAPELDRSLRFVHASEMADGGSSVAMSPEGLGAYTRFLRRSGVVLEQLPLEGVSHVLCGHDKWHPEEGGFGDFAWDLVKTDEAGARHRGDGAKNEDYGVWNADVFLPTGGWVLHADDSAEDNAPGSIPPLPLEQVKNNMLGVWVSGGYYVYLLHLQRGSIPRAERGTCAPAVPGVRCVQPGVYLPAGSYVGRVGNSGVTYEPHLHVTAYYWDAARSPQRSWGVPIEFADIEVRTASSTWRRQPFAVPVTGDDVRAAP